MYIVGIDIAKNHHEASIIDYSGKLVGRSCRFTNTPQRGRQTHGISQQKHR